MAVQKVGTNIIDSGYTTTITTNPEFAGTEAAKMPSGTTAQRANAQAGDIRFNTTLALMEYYDGSLWKSIDAPPAIVSVSGAINENTDSTLTINGSNLQSGAVVYIEGAGVSNTSRALTTTYVNSTQLTAATNAASVNYVGGALYDVKVMNPSGLTSTIAGVGAVDRDPTWTTASGTLATIYDSSRASYPSLSVLATDAEGTSVTYAIASGSLPTGMSLNTSTGAITGTPNSVGSDTTYTFSVVPTSNGQAGVARSFSITIKAPVTTVFSYTGSDQTWTIPTANNAIVNRATVKLWGAGGGFGDGISNFSAGAGGGGFTSGTLTIPSGTSSYRIMVGQSYGRAAQSSVGYGGAGYRLAAGKGGNGGGLTGIFTDNGTNITYDSTGQGRAIAIAGGGGGSGYDGSNTYGGSGGGSTGGTGQGSSSTPATGGTQSAGGAGSYGTGSQLTGAYTNNGNNGGGGGGYWGGGTTSGGSYDAGGGGGSGYVGGSGSHTFSGTTTNGSQGSLTSGANNPGGTGDANWNSVAGKGEQHGRAVIIF